MKDNWFFIRQDIRSYLLSTIFYLMLCLSKSMTLAVVVYSLFECLVFYLPFWFIRVCFSDTYHSDNWNHCKFWTRTMLCSGVFTIWMLPLPYSLWKPLSVAFLCCLILYLVALETNDKRSLFKRNEELSKQIQELLLKNENPKEKLINMCREKKISNRDTDIAVKYFIEGWKPKQIWIWLCNNQWNMEYDSVYKIINRLNKKLK